METLHRARTANTPEVHFDPGSRLLSLVGESYPDNAGAFYGPLKLWIEEFLAGQGASDPEVILDLAINYFNSSSSKALMDIFDLCDAAAARGVPVLLNWRHHPDNDMAREYGADFEEDLQHLTFRLLSDPAL